MQVKGKATVSCVPADVDAAIRTNPQLRRPDPPQAFGIAALGGSTQPLGSGAQAAGMMADMLTLLKLTTAAANPVPNSSMEAINPALTYPRIDIWLPKLDSDPVYGEDGHDFAQFVDAFQRARFIRISNLAKLDFRALPDLLKCPEMAVGTAQVIIEAAQRDVKRFDLLEAA